MAAKKEKEVKSNGSSPASGSIDLPAFYESLKVVHKANEDQHEVRCSADEKVWAVRYYDDDPKKPTICVYSGVDAKDLAWEQAGADFGDDDFDDDEEDFGDDDAEDDEDDDTDEDEDDDE